MFEQKGDLEDDTDTNANTALENLQEELGKTVQDMLDLIE